MKKIISFIFFICTCCNLYAQGYALDEVYKESSSRDSDFNPFYAFIGIIILIGIYYLLKSLFSSSSRNTNGMQSYKHTIKEPSEEEIMSISMREVSKRFEYLKQKEEAQRDWSIIQKEALNILKTEYQTPYLFDNVIFKFNPNDLDEKTIEAFTRGYYWGLIRRFEYTPQKEFNKTYHIVVRLGYERGLKEPRRSVTYCSEVMKC